MKELFFIKSASVAKTWCPTVPLAGYQMRNARLGAISYVLAGLSYGDMGRKSRKSRLKHTCYYWIVLCKDYQLHCMVRYLLGVLTDIDTPFPGKIIRN